jgi:C4-dicarboxylate transporter, DctM subunit
MDNLIFFSSLLILLAVLLSSGVWIGISLIAVAAFATEIFANRSAGAPIATAIWSSSSSWILSSLPMFIWMGDILFRTKLSEDLFRGLAPLFGRVPGGLLHTNVMGCTLFGAVSGSSVATLTTVSQMTLPELKKRNYPEHMIIGTLAGPATLGLMIPPSIMMVVYGAMTRESISEISIAGIIPGLVLALFFTIYVAVSCSFMKDYNPTPEPITTLWEKFRALRLLIPVVFLMGAVLGTMFAGIATATEAAALGVGGSLGLAFWQGTLTRRNFVESLMASTRTSTMIMLVLLAGSALTQSMSYTHLPEMLASWVSGMGLTPFWLLMLLLLLYTILGGFLDGISCIVLTIPLIEPMLRAAGIDMVWFGIFIVLVVEKAQITPPIGFNLFVLQSMTGHNIFKIAKWSLPMYLIMLGMVFVIIWFPWLATWLPHQMIHRISG